VIEKAKRWFEREETLDFLPDSNKCEICGVEGFERVDKPVEVTAEHYETNCPNDRCIGEVDFVIASYDAGAHFTGTKLLYSECTQCDGLRIGAARYVKDNASPYRVESFEEERSIVVSNNIVEHHTSYIPEETMHVCRSCHGKIHHTNTYPEYEPDMTRGEWEEEKSRYEIAEE